MPRRTRGATTDLAGAQDRATIAADVAADHLIEALRVSGFVIMRGPPAPNHAGVDPEHSLLRR